MAVSISYDETRQVIPGNLYEITWTVTSTTDIPAEIFVRKAQDTNVNDSDEFTRVAQVGDFIFPTTPAPLDSAFYRIDTVTVVYDDIATAEKQQAAIRANIAALADAYEAEVTAWVGSDSITVP